MLRKLLIPNLALLLIWTVFGADTLRVLLATAAVTVSDAFQQIAAPAAGHAATRVLESVLHEIISILIG